VTFYIKIVFSAECLGSQFVKTVCTNQTVGAFIGRPQVTAEFS